MRLCKDGVPRLGTKMKLPTVDGDPEPSIEVIVVGKGHNSSGQCTMIVLDANGDRDAFVWPLELLSDVDENR